MVLPLSSQVETDRGQVQLFGVLGAPVAAS